MDGWSEPIRAIDHDGPANDPERGSRIGGITPPPWYVEIPANWMEPVGLPCQCSGRDGFVRWSSDGLDCGLTCFIDLCWTRPSAIVGMLPSSLCPRSKSARFVTGRLQARSGGGRQALDPREQSGPGWLYATSPQGRWPCSLGRELTPQGRSTRRITPVEGLGIRRCDRPRPWPSEPSHLARSANLFERLITTGLRTVFGWVVSADHLNRPFATALRTVKISPCELAGFRPPLECRNSRQLDGTRRPPAPGRFRCASDGWCGIFRRRPGTPSLDSARVEIDLSGGRPWSSVEILTSFVETSAW
jgi:hypothetical protein